MFATSLNSQLYVSRSTAEMIENMDKKATWDRFYVENNSKTSPFKNFEWFFGFEAVQNIILPLLQSSTSLQAPLQVLDIGCGTSALGPSVYRSCSVPVRVTCGDISPVAVRLMQEHARDVPPGNRFSQLEFVELDCTQLHKHFGPSSVDLIVDKGTTDALLKSKQGKTSAGLVLKQCLKALRHSGSLLQFSDEDPDARLVWLETEARTARVGVHEVGTLRGVCYFCYHVTPHSSGQH
ncbi:citrate synthase-lysine N-methyltransferase CSKMT, mitochondrial isoform X2 [Corythoichthys intestinalis]|uniref:citrate synthase-lysine N-methyltransferase CSKMT, mitochondrial isoform X2 n=1 Tax=Corythoichthys intestinalis TaxID=161448 RepID=UPI0025A5FCDE|nr:citrate synthase-lysine N-methyltransferase CSKMT, mitochondrial isoform X2 [Corythoichthys intestinalis]